DMLSRRRAEISAKNVTREASGATSVRRYVSAVGRIFNPSLVLPAMRRDGFSIRPTKTDVAPLASLTQRVRRGRPPTPWPRRPPGGAPPPGGGGGVGTGWGRPVSSTTPFPRATGGMTQK